MASFSINNIFSTDAVSFEDRCLDLFQFQYQHNAVYAQWCQALGRTPGIVSSLKQIPFLPISFFKTHRVCSTDFTAAQVFESSGTTTTVNSRHYVRDASLYEQSFRRAFHQFYGDPSQYCILALLPSYLERGGSSLVYMVDALMKDCGHPQAGFFLHDHTALANTLKELEAAGQPTILFGVTYALLDFAESYPMPLRHTTIIETGGMKGRKKEMTRLEVHQQLQSAFVLGHIASEYSMTELLSQAYARGAGLYECPPWMKILLRSEDDPLEISMSGRGVINIIDLANVYSCAFIATDDAGLLHDDGRFEVLGRIDNSDIRGCSLLYM